MRNIKNSLKKLEYDIVAKRWQWAYTRNHKKELKRFCKTAGVELLPQEREEDFITTWSRIYDHVDISFFRFYSHFIGNDPNVVPDDIFHIIIEPCLNAQSSLTVYSNKNLFEKLVNRDLFPVCVLRNMDTDYMDRDYHVLDMTEDLFGKMVLANKRLQEMGCMIVKPTVDTAGGAGVRLFKLTNGKWRSNDGFVLTLDFLNRNYRKDFIIQECVSPSDFVKQFNPTSYSTFRIFTYRSVIDDEIHFIGGYLRVGALGSFKDNIWGGGYACFINADGTLSDFASDAKRKRYDNINGVYLKEPFEIPNFNGIMDVVTNVAKEVIPNRLISFDIMLNEQNEPKIIEFNIKHQTVTTIQTMKKTFFGEFTDEVIDYCRAHKDKICYQSTIRA